MAKGPEFGVEDQGQAGLKTRAHQHLKGKETPSLNCVYFKADQTWGQRKAVPMQDSDWDGGGWKQASGTASHLITGSPLDIWASPFESSGYLKQVAE